MIRIVVTAVAVWVATAVLPGVELRADATMTKIGTLLAVAVIFGVVNGVLKPIIHTLGCAFYVLTLGIIALVVNGALLLLVSKIAGALGLPFHVVGLLPAVWGALIIGIVSWLLGMFVGDDRRSPAETDRR